MGVVGRGTICLAPTGVPMAPARWGGPWAGTQWKTADRRLFCFAVQSRRRRKKAGGGRCGKTIEARPVVGQTPSIRGRRWAWFVQKTGKNTKWRPSASSCPARRQQRLGQDADARPARLVPCPIEGKNECGHDLPVLSSLKRRNSEWTRRSSSVRLRLRFRQTGRVYCPGSLLPAWLKPRTTMNSFMILLQRRMSPKPQEFATMRDISRNGSHAVL
ncbi:hypothetical protein LMIY3S_06002 [Labrys miyagiensis]